MSYVELRAELKKKKTKNKGTNLGLGEHQTLAWQASNLFWHPCADDYRAQRLVVVFHAGPVLVEQIRRDAWKA